jgi:hypothetical protein
MGTFWESILDRFVNNIYQNMYTTDIIPLHLHLQDQYTPPLIQLVGMEIGTFEIDQIASLRKQNRKSIENSIANKTDINKSTLRKIVGPKNFYKCISSEIYDSHVFLI